LKPFTGEAWSLVGRKVSKAQLINDIYETASSSIALPVPEDAAAIAMFRMIIAQARSLIQQRNQIEALAQTRLAGNRDYGLLRQIPGIGPINALTIPAEAGDLRRFRHHHQFLKFCGLDLAICQSGTFRSRTKLSKYGNARLRRTFWMAAQVAARQRDNSFRDKLGRYVAGTGAIPIASQSDDCTHRQNGAGGACRRQNGNTIPTVRRAVGCQVEGPLSASAVRALRRDP
jgi:transposase